MLSVCIGVLISSTYINSSESCDLNMSMPLTRLILLFRTRVYKCRNKLKSEHRQGYFLGDFVIFWKLLSLLKPLGDYFQTFKVTLINQKSSAFMMLQGLMEKEYGSEMGQDTGLP